MLNQSQSRMQNIRCDKTAQFEGTLFLPGGLAARVLGSVDFAQLFDFKGVDRCDLSDDLVKLSVSRDWIVPNKAKVRDTIKFASSSSSNPTKNIGSCGHTRVSYQLG